MAVHRFHAQQFLKVSPEVSWDFFSNPGNLSKITPKDMMFKIISGIEKEVIYPGIIISYVVKPLPLMQVEWVTEITTVDVGKYFVDEQKSGPFSIWHHQHHFTPVEGGVMMEDILHYKLPGGILGNFFGKRIVQNRIEEIFEFRRSYLENHFNS